MGGDISSLPAFVLGRIATTDGPVVKRCLSTVGYCGRGSQWVTLLYTARDISLSRPISGCHENMIAWHEVFINFTWSSDQNKYI